MGIEDDYILDETPDIEPEEPEEEPEPSAADELREELKEEAKEKLKEKAREKYDRYKEGKKATKEGRPGEPPRAKQVPEAKPGAGAGKGVGEAGGQAGKAAGKAGVKAGGEAAKGVAETGAKAGEGLARAGATGANVAKGAAGVAETGEVAAIAWPIILGIIIALIILAIILFIIGFVVGLYAGGRSNQANSYSYVSAGQAEGAIRYPTNCTTEAMTDAINQFIDQCSSGASPLAGRGDLFVKTGAESGLNPFFIAAQACMENQFATTGYAASNPASYNTFGHKEGTLTRDYGTQGWKSPEGDYYMAYPNWEASLAAHANLITHYIANGRDTLYKIFDKYATGDTDKYVSNVSKWINQMFSMAGCSPVSDGNIDGSSVSSNSIEQLISNAGFNIDDVAVMANGNAGTIALNQNTLMPSASSIKAGLLLAYLLENDAPTNGSSIDNNMQGMIVNSNNSNANSVLSAIGGTSKATSVLNNAGISGVEVNRTFGTSSTEDNLISAQGAVQVLQAINNLPTEKKNYALNLLSSGDTGTGQDYIRNALGGAEVYSKSGQGLNNSARNDIAIISNGNNNSYMAILVKTDSSNTAKAQELIANIARTSLSTVDQGSSVNCQ